MWSRFFMLPVSLMIESVLVDKLGALVEILLAKLLTSDVGFYRMYCMWSFEGVSLSCQYALEAKALVTFSSLCLLQRKLEEEVVGWKHNCSHFLISSSLTSCMILFSHPLINSHPFFPFDAAKLSVRCFMFSLHLCPTEWPKDYFKVMSEGNGSFKSWNGFYINSFRLLSHWALLQLCWKLHMDKSW